MSTHLSIARPYANAAFEYAREKQQLPAWKSFLESAACLSRQPAIAKLVDNPEITPDKLLEIFRDVLKSQLDKQSDNFLKLLSQHKRLSILPEIAEYFNGLYAVLEKISNVSVTTAVEAQAGFQQKLVDALTKRIQRNVTLECKIDPAILGGALIQIGDRVIDVSIRGKLNRLAECLNS